MQHNATVIIADSLGYITIILRSRSLLDVLISIRTVISDILLETVDTVKPR